MRLTVIALILFSLSSQAQLQVKVGYGLSYRLAGSSYFWSEDGKMIDQPYSGSNLELNYKVYKRNNYSFAVGIHRSSFAIMSTIIEYPSIRGWGSGGGAIPGYDEYKVKRWKTAGLSAVFNYTKNQHSFNIQFRPAYVRKRESITVKDYDDRLQDSRNSYTYSPQLGDKGLYAIGFSLGGSYYLKQLPGVSLNYDAAFSPFDTDPFRMNFNLLFGLAYCINWSKDNT